MDNGEASTPGGPSKFRPIIVTNGKSDGVSLSSGREFLKKWLGRKIRVVLENKLVLIGIFSCTDHDENLVLSHCGTFAPESKEPVSVGKVCVPGHQISTVSVDMPADEADKQGKSKEI